MYSMCSTGFLKKKSLMIYVLFPTAKTKFYFVNLLVIYVFITYENMDLCSF